MKRSRDILIVLLMLSLIFTWVFHLSGKHDATTFSPEPVMQKNDSSKKINTPPAVSCDSVFLITKDSLLQIEKQLRLRIDTLGNKESSVKTTCL
jgi:hypothetical protein